MKPNSIAGNIASPPVQPHLLYRSGVLVCLVVLPQGPVHAPYMVMAEKNSTPPPSVPLPLNFPLSISQLGQ